MKKQRNFKKATAWFLMLAMVCTLLPMIGAVTVSAGDITTLPDGEVGKFYTTFIDIGKQVQNCYVEGTLPPGLSLKTTYNGFQIDGTPTVAGTYTFFVSFYGVQGILASGYYTIVISGQAEPSISVILNKDYLPMTVGTQETLIATVLPDNVKNKAVTWSSNNESAAKVDQYGRVSATGIGAAVITVKTVEGGATASCLVIVDKKLYPEDITGISLNKDSTTIVVGESEVLIATIEGNHNFDYGELIWSSTNTRVASVDRNGKVTAIAVGTTVITAKIPNGLFVNCYVTVIDNTKKISDISLNYTSLTMWVNEAETLTATVDGGDYYTRFRWTSSNEKVATVSENGRVIAISEGTANITVTAITSNQNSVSATCLVTVESNIVTDIILNKSSTKIAVGETEVLTATVIPGNIQNTSIQWTSSSTRTATVDKNGKVTAVAEGTTTITAMLIAANGDRIIATCTVTVVSEVAVTGVSLNKTSTTIQAGKTETLTATVSPSNAAKKTVTWTSSNEKVAVVEQNGKVTAVSAGTATISVKTTDGSKTASCTVNVTSTPLAASSNENEKKAQEAVKNISDYIRGMDSYAKESSDAIDLLILFAENEILKASTKDITGSEFLINRDALKDLQNQSLYVKSLVEQLIQKENIDETREIRNGLGFKNAQANKFTIKLDSSAGNMAVDGINIQTGNYAVSIPTQTILEDVESGSLTITIEKVTSTAMGKPFTNFINFGINSNLNSYAADTTTMRVEGYKVTLGKNLKESIKVSLDPLPGDPTYQAIFRQSDGTSVGGKYNPSTRTIDVRIRQSGTYIVKENKKDFSDIANKNIEMQEAIRILASKGIINGKYEETSQFCPDDSITRAEVAALIVRTLSMIDVNSDGNFIDVPKYEWYFTAVSSAKKYNIVNGTSSNTFEPDKQILKEQIIAIMARTLRKEMKYKDPKDTDKYINKFVDRDEQAMRNFLAWGTDDFALASRENLIVLRSDGRFNPTSTMTRGDAAVVLYRLFKKIW